MKLSALNSDFSGPSADLLCSKRPAHASAKEGYPSKSGYFIDIGSSSMKTKIGTDMLLIITSNVVTSFLGVSTYR